MFRDNCRRATTKQTDQRRRIAKKKAWIRRRAIDVILLLSALVRYCFR